MSKSLIQLNTKIGFPIICLTDQLEAINLAITGNKPTMSMVHEWLKQYGLLISPDEEHSIRWGSLGSYTTSVTKALGLYIFLSDWGFVNILGFDTPVPVITVPRPLGGLPYDRYKKWVEANFRA